MIVSIFVRNFIVASIGINSNVGTRIGDCVIIRRARNCRVGFAVADIFYATDCWRRGGFASFNVNCFSFATLNSDCTVADFDENIMIDLAMGYADQFDELDFSELDSFKIEDVKFSVTLNAATRINLFLKCPVLETEYNDEISFGGESYFWIQGNEIKASQLLESYTFHIETDLSEVDIAISPMQYMFIMLNNEELEDNQKAALAAFVCYAFAANDYVQSH